MKERRFVHRLLCATIFFLPFSLGILQFEIGPITFSPYTLGIVVFAVVGAVGAVMGRYRYRPGAEDLLMIFLGMSFLVSTLRARDVIEAGYLAFHGVFIPIVTYFALKILVRMPEQYRKVLVSFVGGVVAFALYGLVQFALDTKRLHILNMPPISAAALIVAALIVLFYSGWWRYRLGKVCALALLAALVTTFSRGYMVLLLLTPVFFAFFRRGRGFGIIGIMLIASLLGTLLFAAMPEVVQGKRVAQEEEQTTARITDIEYWKQALYGRAWHYRDGLDLFWESPVFGNGFHMGGDKVGVRAVVWHNFHVEWLEYGGLMGYLLYMALLMTHFGAVSRHARGGTPVAVNQTVIFTILMNGLTNSFTAGLAPYLAFLFMGLNRAYIAYGRIQPVKQ